MQGVGEVHSLAVPRAGLDHRPPVLRLQVRQAEELAQGIVDHLAVEIVGVAKRPFELEQYGLRHPQAPSAHHRHRRGELFGIVTGDDPHQDVGVEGGQRASLAPRAMAASSSARLRRGPA